MGLEELLNLSEPALRVDVLELQRENEGLEEENCGEWNDKRTALRASVIIRCIFSMKSWFLRKKVSENQAGYTLKTSTSCP